MNMCKLYSLKNEYRRLDLIEINQLKEVYFCLDENNKIFKLTVLKNKDKVLPINQIKFLSKNKIFGLQKIIDIEETKENISLVTEIYEPLDISKSYKQIISIGLFLIRLTEDLYSHNITNFKLEINNLSQDISGNIIIKDIFIYSDNNHLKQISLILNELLKNTHSANSFFRNKINLLIDKLFNNEIHTLSELKSLLIEIKVMIGYIDKIKITSSYQNNELMTSNKINLKYTNLINQVKSDKIINFNNNVSINNKFNNYEWLYQIENKLNSKTLYKSTLTDIEDKFSGILVADYYTHIFLYNGYVIGAVNTIDNKKDNDAISNLKNIKKLKAIASKDILPILLKNLISSGISIENENYSLKELTDILDTFSEIQFNGFLLITTDKYKFYISFINGVNIFILFEVNSITSVLGLDKFRHIINNIPDKVQIETFILDFNILDISIHQLILKSTVNIKYISKNQSILEELLKLGNEYIPNRLKEWTIKNTIFEKIFPGDAKITLLNGELDVSELIDNSIHYKFIKSLFTDLFFTLDKKNFKSIITSIPQVNNISFSCGNSSIRTIFKNNNNILFISEFTNNSQEDFDKFIDYVKSVKDKQDTLIGAFYISDKTFSDSIIIKYKHITKLSALDKIRFKTTKKSYVKISKNFGFNLFLLNYKNDEFRVYNPLRSKNKTNAR